MARAVSYIRFSTPKQSLGDSLRRQVERTREYCEKHGLILDETIRDEGISGYSGDNVRRGGLGRFLIAVEQKRVPRGTYLILEHLDRFSRQNPRIAMTLLLNLINSGIRVVTLFDERLFSDTSETIEQDLIVAILVMSEAHKASARKADLISKTWAGKRKAMAAGELAVLTRACPAWVRWDEKQGKFVTNAGARTVRKIFEWAAAGQSGNKIARQLNASQTPALTGPKRRDGQQIGGAWTSGRVLEIIKSDTPLGWFQPCVGRDKGRQKIGEPIKDYYPAVVSQELANAARYQISQRSFGGEGSGRNGAVTNLFSGLCFCATCGSQMYLYHAGIIREKGRKDRYHGGYLRCSSQRRKVHVESIGGICPNTGSIPYPILERDFIQHIGDWSPGADEASDDPAQELTEKRATAQAEADKLSETAARYLLDDDALIAAALAKLKTRHTELVAQIADLDKQIQTANTEPRIRDELAAMREVIAKMDTLRGDDRIKARTRIAAGFKRFINNITCNPDRSIAVRVRAGVPGSRFVTPMQLIDGRYDQGQLATMRLLGDAMWLKQTGRVSADTGRV